jgi:RimJ/RimL family protein N-acetyltransferase
MVPQTARLRFRDLCPDDLENIRAIAADPEVMRYLLVWLDTGEQVAAFLADGIAAAQAAERSVWLLAVHERAGGAFVGLAFLEIQGPGRSTAEIGYILLRAYWGRGLAAEMLQALLAFGFTGLGLHRIYGKCDERNTPSARVMEKCGMLYEGTLREHVLIRGDWRSSRYYAVLSGGSVLPGV